MPEICLPLRKRPRRTTPGPGYEVGESSAAGAARQFRPTTAEADLYGFFDMLDTAPGRQTSRELGYGITDTWDDLVGAIQEIAPTTLEGVNQRVTELVTTVDQEDEIIYSQLDINTLVVALVAVMSSDSAVTYTFVHSEARSWSIPFEDLYEEAARQLLELAPRPSKYVSDPIELEDHVPVYIPEPEHPEDSVPAEDEAPIEPYITEVASAPTPSLPPPSLLPILIQPPHARATMAQRRATAPSIYHSLIPAGTPPLLPIPLPAPSTSRKADILEADTPPRKRLLLTAPTPRVEEAQKDRAAVRAEIEILRRERLAYKQESIETCQALARSEAYSRALEAWIRVLETSTSHSLPLPPPFILSPTRPDAPSLGIPPPLPISVPTSSPPLLLPSASRREDRPEVTLPPRKRLGIALGPGYEVGESSSAAAARPAGGLKEDYSFVATMDKEIRRDLGREVGYGITDSWDEIVETLQGAPVSTDMELGRHMTAFETRVRQDTDEIYTRLDDEQSQMIAIGWSAQYVV
ncbi:hypothetical protein Tco_0851896 [Tanacetum coccineum]